jgi:dTDP-3-amino-2,3,6-trideoxy-4-keto-D-glucose/dTDP-3-amino-3,4,6-trideoxy-alpha-D-glucose/dTDP-2,6-dideoxy-D-kanosamine transaminase
MKVRYSYLKEQFADPDEILAEIKALVLTGDFTLGAQVEQFEKHFANLIGTQYAVGVGSGTDALMLSLKALDVGPGDEVITAANTFIATAGAINAVGARPVFVDVTEQFTLNTDQIEQVIGENTKAILPVHLTGEPADMDEVLSISREKGIAVVEDACQAILANYKGHNAGTMGAMGGFSLHPLKNLNVWGDAGVITTNSPEHYERLKLLRNHGMKNRDEISIFGYNSRLDTLQAIVGNWLITQVEDITSKRIENAHRYDQAFGELADKITIPERRDGAQSVFHLYMMQVEDRDDLHRHLLEKGISAKVHYPIPLFLQEGLAHLGYKKGDFPVSERQAERIISLPVDQHLGGELQDRVIEEVLAYYR